MSLNMILLLVSPSCQMDQAVEFLGGASEANPILHLLIRISMHILAAGRIYLKSLSLIKLFLMSSRIF